MYTEKKDKVAAVFAYFGWIFWAIGLIIRNRDDALSQHHLNQGLVLAIAETIVGMLTRLGGLFGIAGLLGLAILVLSIMGIVRAVKGSDEPLPIIGDIKLL